MKTITILFACLFAVAIGAGVSAFTGTENVTSKDDAKELTRGAGQYRYTVESDDINDLKAPGHWDLITGESPDCPDTGDIPCYVNYTGSDFDNFLSTATLPSLIAITVERKEVE